MPSPSSRLGLAGLIVVAATGLLAAPQDRAASDDARWKQHDLRRPRPAAIEPADQGIASKPPKGAVVLFDGSGLDAWKSSDGGPARWTVADGVLEVAPGAGAIETKRTFGDIQLHVEWAAPDPPRGKSQGRGNSGVFLMGQFEVQVLDSYQADTYADGQAGAIYGQYPPLFNASRPPGRWQSYDIAFRRPRFDASGRLTEPARITVFHNGILVQDNEEPVGPTSWLKYLPYEDHGGKGPISLQDHGHPVRFRNLWLLELPERAAPTAQDLARPKVVPLPTDLLDRYAGRYRMGSQPDGPLATVAREGGHLTISFPFRPRPLAMEPISEAEFDLPSTDARVTFLKDDRGRVTRLRFRVADGSQEMTRVEE
jgi:hypothetical protein